MNDLCVFAVKRGNIEKRFDPHANHPKFQTIFSRLKKYTILPLRDYAECIFSGMTPKSGGDAYTESEDGILFIKSGCLSNDGRLTIDSTSKIKSDVHNRLMKSSQLKKNDVLIAIVGATIGKVGLFDLDCEANINQAIAAARLKDTILPEFLVAYMLSPFGQAYLEYLKRPVARANINLDEIGQIGIPCLSIKQQKQFIKAFYSARDLKEHKIKEADKLLENTKKTVFETIDVLFEEYIPSLYSFNRLRDLIGTGIFCNPHSNYLNTVFAQLRKNGLYIGDLAEFVEINPTTSRAGLQNDTLVSFVPMPAVEERTNNVSYEVRYYKEVKTGFTVFQKDDLLWAKITPCMQNGKSFVASNMPTEIGFGSTEFHVLRKKDERIYMPYLWVLLTDSHILEAAQGMFSGSAGQQRVSDLFLKRFPIVLPPVEKQKKLADQVFKALETNRVIRDEAEEEWQVAKEQFERELLGE